MRRLVALAALTGCALAAPRPAAADDFVWWEAERATETNFPRESPFAAATFEPKRDLLSAGDWLSIGAPRSGQVAFARYTVPVEAGGRFNLWCRKFWKHGPFRWRFDGAEWRTCSADIALADSVTIRTNLCANWVHLGGVDLGAGNHAFELELLAADGETQTAAFDCFLLIPGPFEPRGKLRPGQVSGRADTGFFAWEPGIDPFAKDAMLDLRSLNEARAGQSGFVRRDGAKLVLGSGRPVRFWGVNAGPGITGLDHASVTYLARRLAKTGVNLVRIHGPVFTSDPATPDPRRLDDLFFLVSALRAQGIYSMLSFYFPLWLDARAAKFPGFETGDNVHPFALLMFEPRLQAMWKTWAKALLGTRNPYTGVTLAKDPAVAVVEIQNEDSFFFWTFTHANVPAPYWEALEKKFGAWAAKKYGGPGRARAAWLEAREPGDDPAGGRAAVYEIWHMTGDGMKAAGPGKRKRVGDQVRFLAELQRGFYADTIRWLRRDLGVKSVISPSNWTTADAALLDPLERWTYTAGDLIDRHGYFDDGHTGEGAAYSVRTGHAYVNHSALREPEALPVQVIQPEGYPVSISEIGWTAPNRFRADYAPFTAAYAALQGVDAVMTFALSSAFWETDLEKWGLATPAIMGAFPAAALLYRRGDVREAPDAVRQTVRLEDLFALKGAGGYAAQALDPVRAAQVPPGKSASGIVSSLDPLAFYTGRVVRAIGANPAASTQVNLASLVHRGTKTVRSLTGEVELDWARGVLHIESPRARGAAGFLSQARTVALPGVTIESENEYASVLVVSLDGAPVESSKKILIQCVTTEQRAGFKASNGTDGVIQDLGEPPIGMEKIRCTVTLALDRGGRPRVVALDPHGVARNDGVTYEGGDGGAPLTIRLLEDAPYHVVLR